MFSSSAHALPSKRDHLSWKIWKLSEQGEGEHPIMTGLGVLGRIKQRSSLEEDKAAVKLEN